MKRREFVAGGLSLLGVGVVGATRADDLQSTASRPGRLDDAGSGADTDASATSDAGDDATAESDGAGGTADAESASIEVLSTASGVTDVRLRLVRERDDAVVLDRVRSFDYGERAYLSGRCERGEAYRFTLAVDDGVLVRETVSAGERAVFELLDETTVSVVA